MDGNVHVVREEVRIVCSDDYVLGGTLYCPASVNNRKHAVVIFPGVGIPALYYRSLAQVLASADRPVLTFDYRGVATSEPATLRGFDASTRDWASKDCAAAIGLVQARFPRYRVVGIAHSFGSFLVGCCPEARHLSALAMLGPHTAFPGDYAAIYKPVMRFGWHVLMPIVARMRGYLPGKWFGLPSNLPLQVALDWGSRRGPDIWRELIADDPRSAQAYVDSWRARMQELRVPILAIRSIDDAFSTRAGALRLLAHYAQSSHELESIEPRSFGLRRLGHMRYLSSRLQSTWCEVDAWLDRKVPFGEISNASGLDGPCLESQP